MRRFLAIMLTILYQMGIGMSIVSDQAPSENIGAPSSDSYTQQQLVSRNPWDMVIIDNKLYLGGGDFGDNTGPVDIYCYDLNTEQWSVSGTLNDEAIGKFVAVGEQIYAPGFDSKAGTWDFGNFHWLEDGKWHTNSTLPDAVHNFDVAEFNGKLFFAIGTANAKTSPVKVSSDEGETFQDVSFYKNGINVFDDPKWGFTRVYDFFVIDDAFYCMFISITDGKADTYDFYKYENDAFQYISNNEDINFAAIQLKQVPIAAKATYKGQCYIASGYLNRTTDFTSCQWIELPYGELALDLLIDNDVLYVLSGIKNEDGYSMRIYAYVYNSFFFPVTSFECNNMPLSFVKHGNTFYIGLSHWGTDEDLSGTVYKIEVPQTKLDLINDCL